MKKQLLNIILSGIILLGINFTAKSQNYVGLYKTEIQNRFKDKGIDITTTTDKDGTYYMWFFNESDDYQAYYLNSDNICYQYTVVFKEVILDELVSVLLNKGYIRYSDGYFKNDEFKIKIDYLSYSRRWYTATTYR
jgi:hypothetical protein